MGQRKAYASTDHPGLQQDSPHFLGAESPEKGKNGQKSVTKPRPPLKIQISSVGFMRFVHFILTIKVLSKAILSAISLVLQWSGLLTPNAGGMGLTPSQGTRSQMLHGVAKN